ncbi:MAG: transposase, partial [Imperialibacter sp.]
MQSQLFQPDVYIPPKWYNFKETELGKVYSSLPWDELAKCLPKENIGPGAPRWFDARGMFALMFLKSYLNISDEKLIERFNTDWALQLFCGKLLADNEKVKDKSILTRIRTYIAENTDLEAVQGVLIDHWKRDMSNTHVLQMDATCYESYIRFPTDVKLLWESCEWVFEKQLYKWCRVLGIKRPRSKYIHQKRRQMDYERKRKKTHKEGTRRKKALLYLLDKGLKQLQHVLDASSLPLLTEQERVYLKTIRKVLNQQDFLTTHPASELKDSIVSLPKPYVRPIVRGKENKRVEFGMKVHMLQVDGICLIDKMSFNAFNESTRLKASVLKHKNKFNQLHQLEADRIYATNANRRYCTSKKIFTC